MFFLALCRSYQKVLQSYMKPSQRTCTLHIVSNFPALSETVSFLTYQSNWWFTFPYLHMKLSGSSQFALLSVNLSRIFLIKRKIGFIMPYYQVLIKRHTPIILQRKFQHISTNKNSVFYCINCLQYSLYMKVLHTQQKQLMSFQHNLSPNDLYI